MSKTHSQYQEQAHQELGIVMELLEATYPLSKDPKVLVSALHHLKAVHEANIGFIAYLQKQPNDLESFFKYAPVDQAQVQTIKEVAQLCKEQEESDVEFRRKDSYVLCGESYKLSTLTIDQLKLYLQHSIALTKKILR